MTAICMLKLCEQVKEDDCGVFVLSLDFQQFRKFCDVETFYKLLLEGKNQEIEKGPKPKEALLCMSAAIHMVKKLGDAKINIRLQNYPESTIALKNLKAAYIGNLLFSSFLDILSFT